MSKTDVLIVGGGPAGLLAAVHLSKRHRVTLIEQGRLGQTSKFWVTTERRLKKHHLADCILYKTSRTVAGTFLGGEVSAEGDFAVVDDQRVLQTLIERCREHGVILIENCSLLNLVWNKHYIQANTTSGSFNARVIGDASGGGSLIAKTFHLHQIDGYYIVYGGLIKNIKLHTRDIVLGHVTQLGDPPPILEVIPTGEDSAYCVTFVFSRTFVEPKSIAGKFEDQCRYNPFFDMTPESLRGVEKAGVIPIGRRRRRKLPGLVSLGEAGLIQPPLLATSFNEVLEHTESVCSQISSALARSEDLPELPRRLYPLLKRAQDRLQLPIVRSFIDGDIERLDKVLRIMGKLPASLNFKFFSHELTWGHLASIAIHLQLHLLLGNVIGANPRSAEIRSENP